MKRLLLISAPILSALLLFFPATLLHKKNVKRFEENKQRTETAEAKFGALPDRERYLIRAHAAASDNIALFFGEDIFIAIGSILLIQASLMQYGIEVTPFQLAMWAIPTALAALAIHSLRLWLLDRRLKRALQRSAA